MNLSVFESSCHLPTCLSHAVKASHCPRVPIFIAKRPAGKLQRWEQITLYQMYCVTKRNNFFNQKQSAAQNAHFNFF